MTPSEPIRPDSPAILKDSPIVRLRVMLEEARSANLSALTPEQGVLSVTVYNEQVEQPLAKLEENLARKNRPKREYLDRLLDEVRAGIRSYYCSDSALNKTGPRIEELKQNRKSYVEQSAKAEQIISMGHRYIFKLCQIPSPGSGPDEP
jgi:hypothetical protein